MHQWQTSQQILFYYDPQSHELQNSFFDASIRAKKITLLFLASGDDIRINAALFHQKVTGLLANFIEQIKLPTKAIRLRDHQHLTYDLFAKNKGCLGTQAHKLRPIYDRYKSQDVVISAECSAISYAVINLHDRDHGHSERRHRAEPGGRRQRLRPCRDLGGWQHQHGLRPHEIVASRGDTLRDQLLLPYVRRHHRVGDTGDLHRRRHDVGPAVGRVRRQG